MSIIGKSFFPQFVLFFSVTVHTLLGQENPTKDDLQKLIVECDIEPLYLEGNLDKIKEGSHEEFRMNVLYKGTFYTRTRSEWLEDTKSVRKRNLPLKSTTWEFAQIDYEGHTAVVKLILYEEEELKYVDYLTLYKFETGWRVITKQFSMN
ncbi:nuclear transport factor 2 family protein [uncultured Allomuricauda sp.]|uniref:nuclear transport factor 2 family protein n=1 Tax=Flagellimonas sp. W118 TaxID=3410791 RepID=UPI0026226FA1|nr:nuclear transport factor 2 family protein [uncultured Allomuricauda sp.]